MVIRNVLRLLAVTTWWAGAGLVSDAQKPAVNPAITPPSYQRDIVPILKTACIGCHGSVQPASNYSVASYDDLFRASKKGVQLIPGKSAQSRFLRLVSGVDPLKMPPGSGLQKGDVDTIKRWIDAGAKRDALAPVVAVKPISAVPIIKDTVSKPVETPKPQMPASLGAVVPNGAPVTSLAYAPNGKLLAIGTYSRVILIDTVTNKPVQIWKGHGDTVRSLTFTPDSALLVAGGGVSGAIGQVRVYSVAGARETLIFGDHTDIVNKASVSPDGKWVVSASSDKTLKVWELATGKLMQTLRDHADQVLAVAWHPSGKHIVSASLDKNFKTWDTATWKRLYSVPAHDEGIYDVDMTPSGNQIYTSGADKRVRVWNFGIEGAGHVRDFGLGQPTWAADVSGTDAILTAGDTRLHVWRLADGSELLNLDMLDDVLSVAVSPDRLSVVAGLRGGDVVIVDIAKREKRATVLTKGLGLP